MHYLRISALAANRELFILIDGNSDLRAHIRTDCTPCAFRSLYRTRYKVAYFIKLLCHGNDLHGAGIYAVTTALA